MTTPPGRLLADPEELDLPAGEPIAVDTEFHGENRYVPRLHLIQIRGADGRTWLVDPHVPGMLEGVSAALLARPWIVHAGSTDLVLLARALGGVPATVCDTQLAAGLVRYDYPAGLARLLDELLGVPMDKSASLSDWSKRPLTPRQIAYAAADVAHLHRLWEILLAEAERRGRAAILHACCAQKRADALAGASPDEAWRHVPGRMTLGRREAAVLVELAAWRERHAADVDRPPHSVLGNRTLVDLAKRRPDTPDGLISSRRAPKSALNKHATALLAAIDRGMRRPGPLTFPKGGKHAARLAWLQAWAARRSYDERWSTRLVLPAPVLEAFAHEVDPPLRDWQRDLAGRKLLDDLDTGVPLPWV